MSSFTTALYALNFLSITAAFSIFEWAITRQIQDNEELERMKRV